MSADLSTIETPIIPGGGSASAPNYGAPATIVGTVGAAQGGAAQIVSHYTVVTGAGGNVSAIMPAAPTVGDEYIVELAGDATQLCLFPQVGGQIDSNGTDNFALFNTNSLGQTNRIRIALIATSSTQWKTLLQRTDNATTVVIDTAQTRHFAQHDFHGESDFQGNVILLANVGLSFAATLSPSGATQTVSWAGGCSQKIDAASTTGTLVLTFSNPIDGGRYVLKTLGKTGRVWTFPASVKWAGGVAPTVTAVDGAKDAFEFYYDAGDSTYIGRIIAQNVS